MSIEHANLTSANGKDVFIESEAYPGHFLTIHGEGGAYEQLIACFKPAGNDMAAFRIKLDVVGTGVTLRRNGKALRHHGWVGRFDNVPLTFYVGEGLVSGAGIVNIDEGTNPWKRVGPTAQGRRSGELPQRGHE